MGEMRKRVLLKDPEAKIRADVTNVVSVIRTCFNRAFHSTDRVQGSRLMGAAFNGKTRDM
jgi:hypothetical protein